MKTRHFSLSVVVSLLLSLTLLMAGCGTTTEAPAPEAGGSSEETVSACFVGPMAGGAAWGQAEAGFLKACSDFGWEGQYLGPTTSNANNEMINLIETALTNGADVLVCPVMEVDMWAEPLDRAREAGVTVIAINADDPERCDAKIGTNPASIGVNAAEALFEKMDGREIYVATMQTNMTNTVANTAREAFEKRLAELDPTAVIAGRLECDSNAAKAQDNLAALKLSEPRLNSMMSIDSYAGLGAAAFVEERGLQGDFLVLGMDDAPEILRCIKEGSMMCTVALNWYDTGYGAAELAKTIREGGTVEYDNDAGVRVVFAEDVDAYVAEKGIDLNA